MKRFAFRKGKTSFDCNQYRGSRTLAAGQVCDHGAVALPQDLAMMTLLGIEHVERNGHHYYRGLSLRSPMKARKLIDTQTLREVLNRLLAG